MAKTLEEINAEIERLTQRRYQVTNPPTWSEDDNGPVLRLGSFKAICWQGRELWVSTSVRVYLEDINEFCKRSLAWCEEREDA